jgi:PAS domain S-box-containing protein
MNESLQTNEILTQLESQKYALDQSAIVAQTDVHGKINYVNDMFCKISGYSREELVGKDHRIVNSKTHPKEFFENLWKTIQSGQIWRGEVCNRRKTGELYWVSTTVVPLLDQYQKPHQFLSIRQDITALRDALGVIEEQKSQFAAASRIAALGEMAAAVSHEINNPLTVILGRTEMLKSHINEGSLDEKTIRHIVDAIDVTAHRIERIVRSMKTLAFQGNDEPLLPVSVKQLFSEVLELTEQRLKNSHIRFELGNIDPDLQVTCRQHEIFQILVNLINNSIDAVQSLSDRWLQILIKPEIDSLTIRLTDSGRGIPVEVQKKIFQPFFSTKRLQYGTGMGLSISKKLAESNQGSLKYLEAEPFTTFELKLKKPLQ